MLRREIRELRDIANSLDDHAKRGEPYRLTFYNHNWDDCVEVTEPISDTQRKELEQYLKYHFKIWAETWIYIESDRIRQLVRDELKHE